MEPVGTYTILWRRIIMAKNLEYCVVLPVKNEEKNIRRIISNLKNQTIPPRSMIVIDDGSSDATPRIAKKLGCLVLVFPDRGYSAQRLPEFSDNFEIGLKLSLSFGVDATLVVGADLILPPDYVERLWKLMRRDKMIAVASGVIKGEENYNWVRGGGRLYKNSALYDLYKRRGYLVDRVFDGNDTEIIYALMSLGYTFKVYPITYYTTRVTKSGYKRDEKLLNVLSLLSALQFPSILVYLLIRLFRKNYSYKTWELYSTIQFVKDKFRVKVLKSREHWGNSNECGNRATKE